jgi:YYY domain-containing protein
MGNFEATLEVARVSNMASPQFFTQLDVQDVNQPYVAPEAGQPRWPPRFWWWWRASRVIHDYPPDTVSPQLARVTNLPPAPNTTDQEAIDEFPQFSFLLGDMHPHVLALPFALLMMALALNLYVGSAQGDIGSLWSGAQHAPLWPLYALAVGGLSFLNTWDFPIYAFVLVGALALGRWRSGRFKFVDSVIEMLILGATGVILYGPFYRAFTSQAAGIAPNLFNGTRVGQFFIMFGPFIVIGLMSGALVVGNLIRAKRIRPLPFAAKSIGGGIGVIAAMSIGMLALTFVITRVSEKANALITNVGNSLTAAGITIFDHVAARVADPWVPLVLSVSLVVIVLIWRTRRSTSDQLTDNQSTDHSITLDFALLLYAVGLLLTFGVEFAFIIDGFGTRMNTVFKFYYQAWALWTVASAFAAYYLLSQLKAAARITVGAVVAIVGALGLLYPLFAVPDKVDKIKPTLDALEFSGQFAPDEYAAAQWFNQTVSGTPVIVETAGEEYNPGTSRLSTWTGLPSVIGWSVHESQWRGNYDAQGPRVADVKEIYSTADVNHALELLKSYNAAYLVVGPNERRLYPAPALAKFERALPIAFQKGAVTIYQVP